jgi:uncharacterized protein YybS (DUF2232 family)
LTENKESLGRFIIVTAALVGLGMFVLAYVPVINIFTSLFIPLPVLYCLQRWGRLLGLLIGATGLILLYLLKETILPLDSLGPIVFLAAVGWILFEVARQGYPLGKSVFRGAVLMILAGMALLFLEALVEGRSVGEMFLLYLAGQLDGQIKLLAQIDPAGSQLALIKENRDRILAVIVAIFPAIATVSALTLVLVNLLTARYAFPRLGLSFPDFGAPTHWRVNEKTVWLLIAAGFALFIPAGVVKALGINIFLLLLFLYTLNGLATMDFLLQKRNAPSWLRALFYFTVFAVPYVIVGIAALGLVDVWMDFRRRTGAQTP